MGQGIGNYEITGLNNNPAAWPLMKTASERIKVECLKASLHKDTMHTTKII